MEKKRLARYVPAKQSFPGEKNPAFGKSYSHGGRSVKGHYKGHFFRSLLEYSFMKHLEDRGLSLDDDMKYEPFEVPYMFDGTNRTYRVDFYVVPDSTVYEVKPRYIAKSPNVETKAKWDAATAFSHSES